MRNLSRLAKVLKLISLCNLHPRTKELCWRLHGGGGGGRFFSSIVKVPGDVPPARVYFLEPLVEPRVYFLAILVEFSLGKGMLFGNF